MNDCPKPDPDYHKADHLMMIQGVISRMGTNSGIAKAAAVAIVSGLAALGSSNAKWPLLIAPAPIVFFCWMDIYYLRLERLFRHLHDFVRKAHSENLASDPYTMDVLQWRGESDVQWPRVLGSPSIWPFYLALASLALGCGLAL